jgi:hypothetical protein
MLSQPFKSRVASAITLGMISATIAPFLAVQRAIALETQPANLPFRTAQLFGQPATVSVPSGTLIPVTYTEAEKIIVTPDETAPINLTTAANVFSPAGTLVIPVGSIIEGELRPVDSGTQFFAETVIFPNGTERDIVASSDPITDTEIITEDTDPDILRGAAIGAAAAAVLSEIFGDIDFIEVLAGAGLGALATILFGGGEEEVEVVIIEPEDDLDLILDADFEL